jgi:hypothetical protein
MFYMHYTSAVVLAAQCIVGSIALSRSQAQRRPWLFCVAMVAVVCTPGLLDAARIGQRAVEWQAFSSLREYVASLKFAIAFSVTPFLIGLACSLFRSASNKVILGRGALVLGPMVGTIAMVWILVATDRAPLGHYRYSIAAVGASPVLCAIGLSAFRDVGLRCAFALIIGAAAFSQTNLAEHLAYRVLQPPMRFERWSEIVDRVNKDHARQHWALFVFPNLIEDRQMFDRQRFPDKSYFYAPLIVGNQLANSRQLMALPTWAEDRFRDSDIDSIVAAGGAGLIIRGGRSRATAPQSDLAASIMMELETKLSARGAFISFADASPPQSDVQLIWCPVSITQPTQ